jgi:hypothetical protein
MIIEIGKDLGTVIILITVIIGMIIIACVAMNGDK